MKNQSFLNRLGYAANGLAAALKREASFRTQTLLAAAAAVVLALLRPPLLWIALCILSAAAVLALELINTALEQLADHLHPGTHAAIRTAKDCAAAAVLIGAAAAVIVGLLTVAVSLRWI
ncbi:MAG TPA: diacylglycerol kinase [Steroidobacteraceae bacterium]|nr:diacylglycerol kinase [Steroidobacteraceae bacterium]